MPLPLLRSTFIQVVSRIDPKLAWEVEWQSRTLNPGYDRLLEKLAFKVVLRGLTGEDAEFIQRLCRILDQQGRIEWDTPETPEQEQAERPFLDVLEQKRIVQAEKREKARKYQESKKTVVLTGEQLGKLRSPDYRPVKRISFGVELMYSRIPDQEFTWFQVDSTCMDIGSISNRMIKLGILELVEYHVWPTYAKLKRGPTYQLYGKLIAEKRQNRMKTS